MTEWLSARWPRCPQTHAVIIALGLAEQIGAARQAVLRVERTLNQAIQIFGKLAV
jgi:hypothetical protein